MLGGMSLHDRTRAAAASVFRAAGDQNIHITPSRTCGELRALEPLLHQHRCGAIPDQNFNPVSPCSLEDKGRPAEWTEAEHLLHRSCQPVEATAEVDRARRHVPAHHLMLAGDRRYLQAPQAITLRCATKWPLGSMTGPQLTAI